MDATQMHLEDAGESHAAGTQVLFHACIAIGLLLPLFFRLDGEIFRNEGGILYDSGGSIMTVPLPVGLVVAGLGVVLLAGRYRRATIGLTAIGLSVAAMALTTVAAARGAGGIGAQKLVLIVQFAAPMVALVLGQMYGVGGDAFRVCAIGFLGVITLIAPLQLGYSFPLETFRHHVWGFTIYQHRQFVPVVFVAAYLFAAFARWDDRRDRAWIMALAPVMGAYAAASYAMLALGLLGGGLAVLSAARARIFAAHACLALAVGAMLAFLYMDREGPAFLAKFGALRIFEPPPPTYGVLPPAPSGLSEDVVSRIEEQKKGADAPESPIPPNVRGRFADWKLYGAGILESPWTALFGHPRPFDRAIATSAHNYYLDLAYNFGLVALVPLLWLIAYTGVLIWRKRGDLVNHLPLLGLAMLVGFLVFVDNTFKVTFRQPYPGVFGFFLWGLLLAALRAKVRAPQKD